MTFANILGSDSLRMDLVNKSGFEEEFVNECCLLHPLEAIIDEIKKENDVVSKADGYTIITSDFQSVFKTVKKLSTIRIPHKDFSSIPMGIAIDVKEYKDKGNAYTHSELIRLYKKYEITQTSQNIMDTFVVYTREFHEELKQSERHLFSKEVSIDDETLYVADLPVMQDTEGIISSNKINIEKFKQRIQQHNLWNYFEIKSMLFRAVESDKWNVQFLYVRLLEEATNVLEGIKTDHMLLVHQSYDIGLLNDFLKQITRGDDIRIGQIIGSLGLITNKIKYDFYQRSHPFSVSFGVEYPCYALSKSGNTSSQLRAVQVRLTSELQNLSRPFEDIRDAVARSLGLGFWAGAYSPFIVVLAPLLMDIVHVKFDNEKIEVRLDCSPSIQIDGLRMSLYGRDSKEQQTSLHETITDFARDGDSTMVYSNYYLREDDETVSVKLTIYYREHPMYERFVSKST